MKVISGIMLTLLVLSLFTLALEIQPVKAGTITVPDDYPTIQEAINHAVQGDVIYVKAGTYYENVVVNKSVSLFGENTETTIIDGLESGDGVNVMASSIIAGFTIRNGGNYASVRLSTSANSILNNTLTHSWCGVSIELNSDYNLIANNAIMANLNGIAGQMWHNTKIINNTIEKNLMGIWIGPYSQNNVISFNNIHGHWSEGIMIMQSSSNTFECNNIVDNNQGGNSAGITIGFQQGFSSGNKFFHNNIANRGKQIQLVGSEPVSWDDGYPSGGNYWSDYSEADVLSGPNQNLSGSDGIGDTAYVIDANNRDNYPLITPIPPVPWDITGPTKWIPDNKCDIRDVATVAKFYGSFVGDGRYDRRTDLTGPTYLVPDLKIDIGDLALIAKHYGETYTSIATEQLMEQLTILSNVWGPEDANATLTLKNSGTIRLTIDSLKINGPTGESGELYRYRTVGGTWTAWPAAGLTMNPGDLYEVCVRRVPTAAFTPGVKYQFVFHTAAGYSYSHTDTAP